LAPSLSLPTAFLPCCSVYAAASLLVHQLARTVMDVYWNVMCKQALNDQKNEVVQFLKHHELDDDLIKSSVRFLNFRATALVRCVQLNWWRCIATSPTTGTNIDRPSVLCCAQSGNAFDGDEERFAVLSPGIKKKIKIAMNLPVGYQHLRTERSTMPPCHAVVEVTHTARCCNTGASQGSYLRPQPRRHRRGAGPQGTLR
jgi:hypothetical protein